MTALMIQGTTSDAGKSTIVAGLCRLLSRRGIRVAPFKPQNMALNSAVTVDGGEIGRAQALQALAAGIEAHTDMNPVLLKPNTDIGCQVVIHGKALGNMEAAFYHDYKRVAMEAVLASYSRLAEAYDVVLVEGAGSPAEINLRDRDIANMGFAEAVDCPVLIVSDIDRGGVFAHLVGTLDLLSESEQDRVKGFIINQFRGDIGLLQGGLDWLEERTAKRVVGVVPMLHGLHLAAEDALETVNETGSEDQKLKVIVPILPRMSNHTDFDVLRLHPQVDFRFVEMNDVKREADLIILPGCKSVRADLAWLRKHGWEESLQRHLRYGGKLLGICGGFQMLGQEILDPHGLEGGDAQGIDAGLGFFDMLTTLTKKKALKNVTGYLAEGFSKEDSGVEVSGYEIHAGVTEGKALAHPMIVLNNCPDGALSLDGQIAGTYVHGLFDCEDACQSILNWSGLKDTQSYDYKQRQEADINRLADALEQALDMDYIMELLT